VKKILVVQNDLYAPSGHFGASLEKAGAELETLLVYEGQTFSPIDAKGYYGLVVLGGRANGFDDETNPFLPHVLEIIEEFRTSQKPIFGICLGAQLLARSMGTENESNDGWEIAFTDLQSTQAAKDDPVFSVVPERSRFYELHEDRFQLPQGADLLLTGDNLTNQAYRVGKHCYGVQFHPELTVEEVKNLAKVVADRVDENGEMISKRMLNFTIEDFKRQSQLCTQMAERWLNLSP
tara:strand:- start:2736 stop:3443 length:708 start_codon:yes stop_codon:yes gene_type:complete